MKLLKRFLIVGILTLSFVSCKTADNNSSVAASRGYNPQFIATFQQKTGETKQFRHLDQISLIEEDGSRYFTLKFRPLNSNYEAEEVTYKVYKSTPQPNGSIKFFADQNQPKNLVPSTPDQIVVMQSAKDAQSGTWNIELKLKNNSKLVDHYEGKYSYSSADQR